MLKGQSSIILSVAAVFQQKLFASGLGYFQAPNTECMMVIVDPLPTGSGIHGHSIFSPLETLDTYTLFRDDYHLDPPTSVPKCTSELIGMFYSMNTLRIHF